MLGTVLAIEEIELHPAYLEGGGVEQDPRRCSTPCSRRAGGRLRGSGAPIAAVALANQGETVLVWDRATGRR